MSHASAPKTPTTTTTTPSATSHTRRAVISPAWSSSFAAVDDPSTEHAPFVPYLGPRDALTGAPLELATIKRAARREERVDAPVRRTDAANGFTPDLTARPLRLHTQQVETAPEAGDTAHGALGGHAYSRDMQSYLQSGLDDQRAERRADDMFWYRSAYGRGRVYAAFAKQFGDAPGRLYYLAALMYASGDQDAETVATQIHRSVGWVARLADMARRAANTTTTTTAKRTGQ